MHGGTFPKLVKRSREWFGRHHPKVKLERQDPFPGERKATKAEITASVAQGLEVPPKDKRPKGEGGSRMGCALNNYLNLEKIIAQECAITIWITSVARQVCST